MGTMAREGLLSIIKSIFIFHFIAFNHTGPCEEDANGPKHTMITSCKPAFYNVARTHAAWPQVQNQICDYFAQRGIWLDGTLLKAHEGKSLEAFWDEVSAFCDKPQIKTFAVDILSYVAP